MLEFLGQLCLIQKPRYQLLLSIAIEESYWSQGIYSLTFSMNDITQTPQPAIQMRSSKATTKPTSQAPIQNNVGTDKDGMFE